MEDYYYLIYFLTIIEVLAVKGENEEPQKKQRQEIQKKDREKYKRKGGRGSKKAAIKSGATLQTKTMEEMKKRKKETGNKWKRINCRDHVGQQQKDRNQ